MSEDRCHEEIDRGVRCEREDGHDGPHYAEGIVPAFVGALIDNAITEYEEQARRARNASRGYTVGLIGWIVLCIANLAATAGGQTISHISTFFIGMAAGAALLGGGAYLTARHRARKAQQ